MNKSKKDETLKKYKLSEDFANTSVNQLNLGLIQEEYSGMFEKDLRKILNDKPLTFKMKSCSDGILYDVVMGE